MSKPDAVTSVHFPFAPTGKLPAATGPQSSLQSIKADAQRASNRSATRQDAKPTPIADCQQEPWLTFHFDGTGNNEKIDAPTNEHSNVARLYRARMLDVESRGHVTFYIPGIGTPFKEIGDKGGSLEAAGAWGGQARLDWAWSRLEEQIGKAAARANNPVNKIRMIHVAVFGFSRGAALARAFAVKLQAACQKAGSGWEFTKGHYPIRLYFMGLFDTVASVGVPTSARKYQQEAMAVARASPLLGLLPVLIASSADGHASWASDLRIPAMAERCVHYVAAHEIRNSFPLDTVLQDGHYPSNVVEVVYPGVHSNVGGGYRPGEGGRLASPFGMLSAIPLQAMYDEAYRAGVPLRAVSSFVRSNNPADLAIYLDFYPAAQEDKNIRSTLIRRFNRYMQAVGQGAAPIGKLFSAHMKLYFRWRIMDIGRKQMAAKSGKQDTTAQRLSVMEAQWGQERAVKQAKLDAVEHEAASLEVKASLYLNAVANMPFDTAERESYIREAEQCSQRAKALREQAVPMQATINTMPSSDGSLLKSMANYDQQFLQESQRVLATDKRKLTGFDKLLREAWDEPLNDPDVIAFFDDYVIDSLAGFAKDRTKATEARVLYQGGDERVKYALLSNSVASTEYAA